MTDYHFKPLQNGSDIRGISLTGVPGELPNLTPDEAQRLSMGFLLWLSEKTGKAPEKLKVAVGRDPRVSGQKLKTGLFKGMGPFAVHLLDCGVASTPAMFMTTVFPEYQCDGSIMITASHLPYNRNGFKFFTRDGGLNKSDISQIIAYAESDEHLQRLGQPDTSRRILIVGERTYPSDRVDLIETYSEHLRELIKKGVNHPENYDKPLSGLKIMVDAGNGSGGFYAKQVLQPLGADISSSQHLPPDGTFPNHAPNPEDREAMDSAAMRTLTTGSDLGIIFDTDVDRSAAVDHRGRPISRNGIVALAAALIAEEHPNSTVVTDSITSTQLTDFLENELNLKHFRYKRGYKNVINKALELNASGTDCQLAIETSGHAALKENYFLDDGAYLAAKIIIKTAQMKLRGKELADLIDKLEEPAESKEIRLPILTPDFGAYGDQILEDLQQFADEHSGWNKVVPNHEGVRIAFDGGWFLLRKSLHDPIMPLNLESDRQGGTAKILAELKEFLSRYNQLDLSKL